MSEPTYNAETGEYTLAFTDTGAHSWSVPAGVIEAEVLIVAGGGGGGCGVAGDAIPTGGGGGAGGLIYHRSLPVSGVLDVVVGTGGTGGVPPAQVNWPGGPGSNGGLSRLGDLIAIGGGGGGTRWYDGKPGGSGGGGGFDGDNVSQGGAGTLGQGNSGGRYLGGGDFQHKSGGGGGSGGVGANPAPNSPAAGGFGTTLARFSGFGVSGDFAGGGGGGHAQAMPGGTGRAGGGRGGEFIENGFSATNGTGSGGGGGGKGSSTIATTGGDGGSGIVIVRWVDPEFTRSGIVSADSAEGDISAFAYISPLAYADLRGPEGELSAIVTQPITGKRFFRIQFDSSAQGDVILSELYLGPDIDPLDGVYTSNQADSPPYSLSHLYDGNPETLWFADNPRSHSRINVDIKFVSGAPASQVSMRIGPNPDAAATSFNVFVGDDGQSWTQVFSDQPDDWTASELRVFDFKVKAFADSLAAPDGIIKAAATFADVERLAIVRLSGPEGNIRAASISDFSAMVPITARIYYACDLVADGLPPLRVPISSWQATSQMEMASFAQVVIPGVLDLLSEIQQYADAGGEFLVYRGAQIPDTDISAESLLIRSPMQTLRFQRGPTNATLTISGYTRLPAPDIIQTRILQNIRSQSLDPRQRIRCDIDWFLAPGFTASALGDSFVVGWINYYANAQDNYMDVGEMDIGDG